MGLGNGSGGLVGERQRRHCWINLFSDVMNLQVWMMQRQLGIVDYSIEQVEAGVVVAVCVWAVSRDLEWTNGN